MTLRSPRRLSRAGDARRASAACHLLLVATLACADAKVTDPPSPPLAALVDSSAHAFDAVAAVSPLPAADALVGGATTVFDSTLDAFSFAAPNLSSAELGVHDAGDLAFEEAFLPGSGASGGLGPRFNAASCEGCHLGDGRGVLPGPGRPLVSMLLRVSVPGALPNGAPLPVPGFGDQIQPLAVPGVAPEVKVLVSHQYVFGRYGDGTTFKLRLPQFTLFDAYTALPAAVMISPRVSPSNFGLGLLEAIPEATIRGLSDEFDRNHDGISGKANVSFDVATGVSSLGRFGLKANAPNLVQQSAGAYNGDMGITTSVFPLENCDGHIPQCAAHPAEVSDSVLAATAFYTRTLGVPARRNINDPTVRLGQALFTALGCAQCHVPTLQTGTLAGVPVVSNQLIHPYSDMLLHDMGPGLADNRPDFLANGREWRTPALWGVGLTRIVNPAAGFLHDGRARDLSEAILWHGGEATVSREAFRLIPRQLRTALLAFLQSF